jgi:hypothetical protein
MSVKQKSTIPTDLSRDVLLRVVKLVDIGYVTVIYATFGFVCALIYDKTLGKFNVQRAKKTHTVILVFELFLHLWTIGVLAYLVQNIAELVPYPLDGVAGFHHSRVKELTNAPVFILVLMIFQENLRDKSKFVYNRVFSRAE